ncbi:MAG: hypothetical protein DME36_08960 [Verrucomicrobia bacterium]|nr:MAG: hypothetical protein DME36_08960 [Verrucomicrobiota bacterium]PYX71564.1 MAG: hypothetical protein DMG78_15025 [Acidobacteriota bacterium]
MNTKRFIRLFSPALLLLLFLTSVGTGGAQAAPTSVRINAGTTTPYTDANGNTWLADQFYTGGSTYYTTSPITGTPAPQVFQTERWGSFAYNIPVANGNYNVNLDFAEAYVTGPGQRIFNVSINRTQVLTNFDIYAAAGGMNIPVVKTFNVTVTNGTLSVNFLPGSTQSPKVNGIEVLPASALSPPMITIQPGNQTVVAGQSSTFAVTAGGTAPMSYQWQKNGASIAGATSASYTTPATTTTDNGSTFRVVVSNAAGTITSTTATLTVAALAGPGIQVSSNSINFGNDPVGTNTSQTLVVTNTGTAALSVTQVTASGSTAFTVGGLSLPMSVSPGQKATITANFLPASIGAASGSLSIASSASATPTSIALSGSGLAATYTLNVSPTSLNFGNVTTGTSSTSQNVAVTNTGNSKVGISQISVSGTGYSATGGSAPVTLSPSQTLTLTTQFHPTAAGSANGTISIASNATGSPAAVSLSGTGVAAVQHSVALTWGSSPSTVSGYNLYRSTVNGSSYIKINSSLLTGLTYNDANVQSGTTYYYVTTAVDAAGNESSYSNQVSAAIP